MNAFLLATIIRLAWEATSPAVDTGYRVKWGFAQGGPYDHTVEAGQLTMVTVDEPWPLGSRVFFTAYAYNAFGIESGPSNEVSYLVPIPTPTPTPEPVLEPPRNLQIIEAILAWWRSLFGGA